MFRIQIPKPCHEDWNEMTPTTKGAFCASCSKEVVDFTRMTDTEVQHYFLNRSADQKTCGHFRKDQVERIHIHLPENILAQKVAGWKKFMAILLLVFGSMLFGCDVSQNQEVMGKVEVRTSHNNTVIDTSIQLLGDTTFVDTSSFNTVSASDCTLVGFTISPIDSVVAIINDSTEAMSTIDGDIQLVPIDTIPKANTADYDKVFTGKILLEKKDTSTKKPASDTTKCLDTGYY